MRKIVIISLLIGLVGCGQKGALFLPAKSLITPSAISRAHVLITSDHNGPHI